MRYRTLFVVSCFVLTVACVPDDTTPADSDAAGDDIGVDGAMDAGMDDAGAEDGGSGDTGTSDTGMDTDPSPEPEAVAPCENGDCWDTAITTTRCRESTIFENYQTGRYNVHRWATTFFDARRNVVEVTATAGDWTPVILIVQSDGTVLFDGEVGSQTGSVTAELTRQTNAQARVRVDTDAEVSADVFVTSEAAMASDFVDAIPTEAEYTLSVKSVCDNPPEDGLQSPPNFDETDVENGYYLLPESQPDGLYTRKADGCSRGNKLLIDVIYTVALRWKSMYPQYSPIRVLDLNEGPCSGVDHATHDDGTHVDITADCATQVACDNIQPAVDLAKTIIDTGEVCGIIFDDSAVQEQVNPYFTSNYSYTAWHYGDFMRTVGGHTGHFHIRVKKPDGTCN